VENGRNPDIYTREFVELVRRMNQFARGKQHALAGFRDVLAQATLEGMPELRGEVERVVVGTGGNMEAVERIGREAEDGLGGGAAGASVVVKREGSEGAAGGANGVTAPDPATR
jgi:mediator of RNA polymerase II transcription subunit 10